MKKILFIVMALVYGQFTYAQSDDLQRRVYKMVGNESEFWNLYIQRYLSNDKTQDEAYEAPDSKLLKTWYLMDGQGWYIYDPSRYISYINSWFQITFNANRTFLYVSKNVGWGGHYSLTINRKGTWKRSHQDLTLNFNNALTTVSAELNYEEKENMSARKKAECAKVQAELQRILRLIKSKPETAKITRMDDNVMTLETGHYGLISGGDNLNGTVFYTENGLKEIEEVCREFKNASSDLKYYKNAAENGNAKYQILLAFAYLDGKDGIAKDEAKAAEWFRKAAEQGDASSYNQLAYIEARKGHYDEAIAIIDKAIKLKPDDPNYYDSKGEIMSMKGDKEGAKAMWEKVISLDPKYSENNSPLYQYLFPSN